MSSTSSSIFKTLSMADSCLLSLPSIFASKSPSPSLSIPARPIKLQLSYAFSTPFSPSLSLKKKTQFPSTVVSAAQDEDENTITLDQDEETEAQVSESEGDGEAEGGSEAEGGESGEEGSFEDAEEGSYQEPSEEAKIFVANLPYDVDSERLAMLFEQAGVVEIAEVIYNRETDRSRGFGFVTMSTVEEAQKAVEKFNRYELDGRPLTVNIAAPRGERPERPPPAFATGFRIYIGNLPWDVDNSRLEQIFSEYGKVEDARVVYDRETGRSRGFGFVTMSEESEMNDAIAALDGQSVDGRALRVNVAEQRPRRF